MKKNIILASLLIFTTTIFSQKKSILDSISKKTCNFLNSEKFKSAPKKERTTKLGVYIIELYSEFKEDLKKEGIELDFSKGREGGREFGEKVGLNMVKFCPEALVLLAEDDIDEENKEELEKKQLEVEGAIKSISGKEINIVTIKSVDGKTQKFVWLNNFEGSDELISSKRIKNLKVKVSYNNIEMFSPKLQEYIIRKKITKIEYLD
ncbi:MAG: hypothetical protein ACPGUU_10285 [Flavobacteriaceae bacterium]